jgi:hypothetical protein
MMQADLYQLLFSKRDNKNDRPEVDFFIDEGYVDSSSSFCNHNKIKKKVVFRGK